MPMNQRTMGAVKAAWKAKRKAIPKAAKAGAARIKGRVAPTKELKYLDIASATYVADTTGTVTTLNGIAQSADNTGRDGRQIEMKSVQVRGVVSPNPDGISEPTLARLLIVWDNGNDGTSPSAATTIAAVLTASSSISHPVVDNAARFTILADLQFPVGGQNTQTATLTSTQSPSNFVVNVYKRLNAAVKYIGTSGADASIQNGRLFMITIGNQAAGAGAQFTLTTRVRYTDD